MGLHGLLTGTALTFYIRRENGPPGNQSIFNLPQLTLETVIDLKNSPNLKLEEKGARKGREGRHP
jgi:hypothetical protein